MQSSYPTPYNDGPTYTVKPQQPWLTPEQAAAIVATLKRKD